MRERGGQSTPSQPAGPFGEPTPRPEAGDQALISAFNGKPFDDPPQSAAVTKALGRLKQQPIPAGEVFALISVTDHHTGERRFFTRGTPSMQMAQYLRDPRSAPANEGYAESDEAHADDQVEIVVRAVHKRNITVPRSITRAQEEEQALRKRNTGNNLSHRIEQTLRKLIVSGQISLGSTKPVPMTIRLKNVPRLRLPKMHENAVDGLLYIGLDLQAERQRAIIARKQQMANLMHPLRDFIRQKGGKLAYASWSAGAIGATLPANAINQLVARPDVFSIELREKGREESVTAKYQGDDIAAATDTDEIDPFHLGANGLSTKHPYSSRVVIFQADQCIDDQNPAWLDGSGLGSRGTFYDCDGASCVLGNLEACAVATPHGTRVATQMVADFQDGQDSAVSATDAKIMTGTCPECKWVFLQDQGLDETEATYDFACELGGDIWEQSYGDGTSCDGNGGYDASVEALVDCDFVIVKGAANDGSTAGTCNTHYPADHPWTFTVGGVDTISPCNTSTAWYTADCDYSDSASMGGGSYEGGGTATIVDIAAPYNFGNVIVPGSSGPVTYTEANGTSLATPVVAGLMGRLMDWYKVHVSDALFYSNRARNFMLLMGDRSADDAGTVRWGNIHDVRWGAGRVGLVPFDDKSTWGVNRASATLQANDTWTFTATVPQSATFFKAVIHHDGFDYATEPVMIFTLDPLDCATATKTVTRRDSKAMLVYNSTPLSNCTQIQVTITNSPQNGSGERLFHFAGYSDTENERH